MVNWRASSYYYTFLISSLKNMSKVAIEVYTIWRVFLGGKNVIYSDKEKKISLIQLSLSQTINFGLFQTESFCRWQFQIWWKWQ